MKSLNLLSISHGIDAINNLEGKDLSVPTPLKKHEAESLVDFCSKIKSINNCMALFENYFISYSIPQIGKEFDLLRFGENYIINIELKSELTPKIEETKNNNQMHKNYYYLKFLDKPIYVFTYTKGGIVFKYNSINNSSSDSSLMELIQLIENQKVDKDIDINKMFIPSNYLISPFNSTEKFLENEYFLTTDQQNIKNNILEKFLKENNTVFCISANAGTGKTLLIYDIAKSLMSESYNTLLIHCGKLNEGHEKLNKLNWNIHPIKDVKKNKIEELCNSISIIIIDEAQRIREEQLKLIINYANDKKIKLLFSYDTKQYLREEETTDIAKFVQQNYPSYKIYEGKLTNKIRTNKEIASFIYNLEKIGYSNNHLNYEEITIEYFDDKEDLEEYIQYIRNFEDWKFITFTASQHQIEAITELSWLSEIKAHDVIGQEFPKVALVMDNNFKYDEDNRLRTRINYYSVKGMLYQIVTRVINELKIIVYKNPELYLKLLEIKNLEKK